MIWTKGEPMTIAGITEITANAAIVGNCLWIFFRALIYSIDFHRTLPSERRIPV